MRIWPWKQHPSLPNRTLNHNIIQHTGTRHLGPQKFMGNIKLWHIRETLEKLWLNLELKKKKTIILSRKFHDTKMTEKGHHTWCTTKAFSEIYMKLYKKLKNKTMTILTYFQSTEVTLYGLWWNKLLWNIKGYDNNT